MRNNLVAQSISRPVQELIRGEPAFTAKVLGVFQHACNLVTPAGLVMAVVLVSIGDGPLNMVVEGEPGSFDCLEPGDSAELKDALLAAGRLEIDLSSASIWEPRPDWEKLRDQREVITSQLAQLGDLAQNHAPAGSLLALADRGPSHSGVPHSTFAAVALAALESAKSLWQGWTGGDDQLRAAGTGLAGLGGGLTPAGDDFLSGVMLWAWLTHPEPDHLCQVLVQAAASRTTTLSAALLQAAARGECSAVWHSLLFALTQGSNDAISSAVHKVLAHGATSGADTLAGFLWRGTNEQTPQEP